MEIVHKVQGGKMLRINLELEEDIVMKFRLSGDFFIYPEEGINIIENALIGCKVCSIADTLNKIVSGKKMQLIGFSAEDIQGAICVTTSK